MPRRRSYGTSNRSAAPAAINVKALPLYNPAELKSALSWRSIDEELSLRLATEWYGANQPELLRGAALPADAQKSLDRARLCLNQAEGTPYEHERVHAWTIAVRLFEKAYAAKNLPKWDDAATPDGTALAAQKALSYLNDAYASFGVKFKLTSGGSRSLEGKTILLPTGTVIEMISQTPVKVVLSELATVAQVASIVNDELDGSAFMPNLQLASSEAAAWIATLGGAAAKSVGKAPKASAPSTPSVRAPRAPKPTNLASVSDPFRVFHANTAKAAVAAILFDGAFHSIVDLKKACDDRGTSHGQVNVALKQLAAKGWTVDYRNAKTEVRVIK